MHQIHHTEGFVVGGVPLGEADRYLTLFTREFGMIRAQAKGIRKLSSKLRYSLQDFSFAEIDLVQGKEIWRVTNAQKVKLLEKTFLNLEIFKVVTSIFNLLKRLCQGEEKNELLFDDLVQGFSLLTELPLGEKKLRNVEFVLVLRILYRLGYLGDSRELSTFIESPFSHFLLDKAQGLRRVIVSEINKSLKETQL